MSGWIKLRRSLKDWEWYDDHNATRLLIHLLVSVNYEDKKWKGILIKSGSMVLSWKTLSKNSFMTIRKCRTAMDKLVKSKEVTRYVTNKFQVVTLLKWEQIQIIDNPIDKLNDKQVTNKRQTSDKQVTTTKEYKEVKEYKNTINNRLADFKKSLRTYLGDYDKELLNDFYLYWTEKKPKGKKMLFEMQKTFDISRRLKRWHNNNFNKKEKSSAKKEKRDAAEIILEKYGIN